MAYTEFSKNKISLDGLLAAESTIRVPLPLKGNNLFDALSHLMYFNTKQSTFLRQLFAVRALRQHLSNLDSVDHLNQPLYHCSYFSNPLAPRFEALNLELFARIFGLRVKLYYIKEVNLCCDVYSAETAKTVKLVRVNDFHYEPLISQKRFDTLIFVQNIVLKLVEEGTVGDNDECLTYSQTSLINFEMKSWLIQMSQSAYATRLKLGHTSEDYSVKRNGDGRKIESEVLEGLIEDFNRRLPQPKRSLGTKDGNPEVKVEDCLSEDSFENCVFKRNQAREVNDDNIELSYPYYNRMELLQNSDYYHPDLVNVLAANSMVNVDYHNASIQNDEFIHEDDQSAFHDRRGQNPYESLQDYNEKIVVSPNSLFRPQSPNRFLNNLKASDSHLSLQITPKSINVEDGKAFTGLLKFFDEKNNFGFLTLEEEPETDVFVFGSEFQKANISISAIKASNMCHLARFSFEVVFYWGRHGQSRKAINISVL